jgi:hypothetical protein
MRRQASYGVMRAACTRALEALHDGDEEFAVAILESLLAGLDDELGQRRSLRFGSCGLLLRWPGELEEHLRHVHCELGRGPA